MRSSYKVFLLSFLSFLVFFKLSTLSDRIQNVHPFKNVFKLSYSFFGNNMNHWEAEESFQKQSYAYRDSKNITFDVWTAVCDERFASSKGNTAVHVFVYLRKKFEEDNETRKMLKSSWKCRMFYGRGDRTAVETPLNAVVSNHRNFHALMSYFFRSNKHSCPNHVSIKPG